MIIKNDEEKKREIKGLIIPGSTLCVHGINSEGKELSDLALSILYGEGLRTKKTSNLYYNCNVVGNENDLDKALDYSYFIKDDSYINLLIAVPSTIENINGEEFYMGIHEASGQFLDDKYKHKYDEFLINKFIKENGYIPKEFIVGIIVGITFDGELREVFIENPSYIGRLDIEERRNFGQSFIDNCYLESEKVYNISDVSVEQIEKMIHLYSSFGHETFYFEQLRDYLINTNTKKMN